MRNKVTQIVVPLLILLALPQAAFAQGTLCPGNFQALCAIKAEGGIVGNIINILLVISIVVSLFFLIWGGIKWITSGGDKGKIEQARSTLIAAVVGLAISLLAFFIVDFVLGFFTGQGMNSLQVPTLY